MSGKGDTPRPLSVDRDTFAVRWRRTFCGHDFGDPGDNNRVCSECGMTFNEYCESRIVRLDRHGNPI